MVIRLVIFDADKTLWSHSDISMLALPFRLINGNAISDANSETFCLFEGIRELLSELQRRNVIVALASWNEAEPVKEALRLFGIEKFFKIVKAEFHPNKHFMIEDILSELLNEGIKIKPEEILYVDDRTIHLERIVERIGPLHFVQMWVDAKTPDEILKLIEHIQRR
ncbi:MAG: magnesium-dependent phosphatase-1 [Candidatus Bathycorpusculaceae bacterium]